MFGILALICVYAVLGFMLAWIAGVVAKEDVEVKTGVLILVLTGVFTVGARIALADAASEHMSWAIPLINFASLILMTHLVARLSWKHSAIVALIYTVLLTLVIAGMSACLAA